MINTNCTDDNYLFFRGLNVTTTIGSNQKTLPKVLTGTFNDILDAGMLRGIVRVHEEAGVNRRRRGVAPQLRV